MIFSLRQLQEKCREQQKLLYIAFIDLTKAFDLVSRSGLFKLLQKIGCPPHLLNIIRSFHENIQDTVLFYGSSSKSFMVQSGVEQRCVLAPTLFIIFFSTLLRYAFGASSEGIYIHSRSDGRLCNTARLRSKSKVREILIRDFLYADDAAITSHSEAGLQSLIDQFPKACNEFGLTISLTRPKCLTKQ